MRRGRNTPGSASRKGYWIVNPNVKASNHMDPRDHSIWRSTGVSNLVCQAQLEQAGDIAGVACGLVLRYPFVQL